MLCRNCNKEFTDKFCPNCGQKASISQFTLYTLFIDGFKTFADLDRGFFYCVWMLFRDPKKIILDYLLGKRVNYFNPFRLLLILAAFSTFLSIYLGVLDDYFELVISLEKNPVSKLQLKSQLNFIKNTFNILSFVALPLSAFVSYWFFMKQSMNYAEHFVINAFVLAQQTLVYIAFIPFFILFKENIFLLFVIYSVCTLAFQCYDYFKLFYVSFWFSLVKSMAAVFIYYILSQLLFQILSQAFVFFK